MKQEEKLLYQMTEIRDRFDEIRKALNEASLGIKEETSRFISHLDLLEEKSDQLEEVVKRSLHEEIQKGMENSFKKLAAPMEELLGDSLRQLSYCAKSATESLEKYQKRTRLKELFLSFLVGGFLTSVGIYSYAIRHMKTFTKAEEKTLEIGQMYRLSWRYLTPEVKREIEKASHKMMGYGGM